VDTAQLFILGRQGKEQLATEGVEGSGTVTRIVTGGTGNFAVGSVTSGRRFSVSTGRAASTRASRSSCSHR
jgi:hypothetical protein